MESLLPYLDLFPCQQPFHGRVQGLGDPVKAERVREFSPEAHPPRQAYGLPLVAPVCSISGRPTWFSCLFDLTLSQAAHPGADLPSDSPGSHNILYVFFLDVQ